MYRTVLNWMFSPDLHGGQKHSWNCTYDCANPSMGWMALLSLPIAKHHCLCERERRERESAIRPAMKSGDRLCLPLMHLFPSISHRIRSSPARAFQVRTQWKWRRSKKERGPTDRPTMRRSTSIRCRGWRWRAARQTRHRVTVRGGIRREPRLESS